jgi:hypothetical protein
VSPTSGPAEQFGDALAAEHAAIFGYGVLGAHLDASGAAAPQARTDEAVHRDRRDTLVARLTGAGATPVPAEAAYAVPFPVTDRTSALRLAVLLEERTAAIWRAALPRTTGDDRKLALDALVDCAVRATAWRRIAGVSPATVPFPGKTG